MQEPNMLEHVIRGFIYMLFSLSLMAILTGVFIAIAYIFGWG